MRLYTVKYVSYVAIDVEANSEDEALGIGEVLLNEMTGADFREGAEFNGIELQCDPQYSNQEE